MASAQPQAEGQAEAEDQPLRGEINMIIGGLSESMEPRAAKKPRLEEPIIFIEQDAEGVQIPHNDVVVITANIADYNVPRIFIDNRSSVDILYFAAFTAMGFVPKQLSKFSTLIQGFSRSSIIPEGTIRLPLTLGTKPDR